MPAKYSHVRRRSVSGLLRKGQQGEAHAVKDAPRRGRHRPSPLVDRSLAGAAQLEPRLSELEHAIARILLIRYDHDIARLFSTHLYTLSLVQLPTFAMRCLSLGGPGWLAWNYNSDQVKDFFRALLSMDMRQAGERVAAKSVLWSYTALRQFAMSNNVSVCPTKGLESFRLLPYYPSLKAHLDTLEALPCPVFSKPPHLYSLEQGQSALEDACQIRYGCISGMLAHPDWDNASNWREKVRYGYDKVAQTLWRVAREFDVRGYGLVLRDKLATKWCRCGCSTDHLSQICERTVREVDEQESGVRLGKRREWDGRGSGVYGWETEHEEDIWDMDLEPPLEEEEDEIRREKKKLKEPPDTSPEEVMEYKYLRAEKEKEKGNTAFRKGDYELAVKYYEAAYRIEPELPHYQLNLAQAHLKLTHWIEAEKACTKALTQHRSSKGYYRRARARRMLGRSDEAIKDLRAVLRLQSTNTEAINELMSLMPTLSETPASTCAPLPPPPLAVPPPIFSFPSSSSSSSSSFIPPSSSSSRLHAPEILSHQSEASSVVIVDHDTILAKLGIPKPRKFNKDPPPFVRVYNDSRKLKIVLLPSSSSTSCSDVSFPPPPYFIHPERFLAAAGFDGCCEHNDGRSTTTRCAAYWRDREQVLVVEKAGPTFGKDGKGNNGKGNKKKKRRRSEKAKEIDEMKSEGMNYPSWDRYVVKLD